MLITILNIYNPRNNIKFTKEKKWKKLPSIWFLENKVPYKKKINKKEIINHFAVHTLNINYYLKYL